MTLQRGGLSLSQECREGKCGPILEDKRELGTTPPVMLVSSVPVVATVNPTYADRQVQTARYTRKHVDGERK
jgi:hypothetical protein